MGNKDHHRLLPNLYRHPSNYSIDELLKIERQMLDRFRERSIMFKHANMEFRDDKELATIVIMQHFGVPTRLLDWSESPFVALYFALTSAITNYSLSPPAYDHDAVVWALQPELWNYFARGGSREQDRSVFSLDNTALNYYKPQLMTNINGADLASPALAVYGPHNNERVVAQRGTFTMFGSDMKVMEEQFTSGTYTDNVLVKIEIPKEAITSLLHQLNAIGITDSTIFPDLSGVAKEITRQIGFRI